MTKPLLLILIAAALSASTANAQTTRCGMELGKWVCRTDEPRQYRDIVGEAARARAQASGDVAGFQRDQLRNTVGGLVAQGRCEEARQVALRGGDFALAEQVARACQ